MLEGLCFAFWCWEGQVEMQRVLPAARTPLCRNWYPHMGWVLSRQVYSNRSVTDYLTVITVMDWSG